MAGVVKKLDSKGRLVLGPEYANATVLVEVVSVREIWFYKNSEAFDLVQQGLEEAKSGKVTKMPLQKKASWIDKLED